MRIKTCGGRRKPCAIAPASPSTASGEADAQGQVDYNHPAEPGDGDVGMKNDDNDDHCSYNDEAPDSTKNADVQEKEDFTLRSEDDCEEIDWLEGQICIMCDRGGPQLMLCSESSCPVALHESCLNCKPYIDDDGKFYCPYCIYKRELARYRELKRKAMLARKNLLNFIGSKILGKDDEKEKGGGKEEGPNISPVGGSVGCKIPGTDDEKEKDGGKEEGPNISPVCGTRNSSERQNGLDTDDNKGVCCRQDELIEGPQPRRRQEPDGPNIHETHESETLGGGQSIQEEDIQIVGNDNDEGIGEDQQRTEVPSSCNSEEEKTSFDAVPAERHDTGEVLDGNKEKKKKSELVRPNGKRLKQGVASEVPENEEFEFELSDLDGKTIKMRQKRVKQRANKKTCLSVIDSPSGSSVQPNTKVHSGNKTVKASPKNRSPGPKDSAKSFIMRTFEERRRRLNWTAEEEDMLKEGVQKFSSTVNKNIPWRKILDFGRHVFNPTRAPADLKGKWKTMMAKESSAKG